MKHLGHMGGVYHIPLHMWCQRTLQGVFSLLYRILLHRFQFWVTCYRVVWLKSIYFGHSHGLMVQDNHNIHGSTLAGDVAWLHVNLFVFSTCFLSVSYLHCWVMKKKTEQHYSWGFHWLFTRCLFVQKITHCETLMSTGVDIWDSSKWSYWTHEYYVYYI